MANQQYLHMLKREVESWNQWRRENPEIRPDLSEAHLRKARLRGVDLSGADLSKADLSGADLSKADLSGADLSGADLSKADLSEARLTRATLIETILEDAFLTKCLIYGISAWNVQLEGAIQSGLIITPPGEPVITVDNLEVAQFAYLLLNSIKVPGIINTMTSKVVLILGGFTSERKRILDAFRNELRKQNYLPVFFDFDKSASRTLSESLVTLASLARFIIAEITTPSSVTHELSGIISILTVPIQPLLERSENQSSMLSDLKRYPWLLPVYRYNDIEELLSSLKEKVIAPAEKKAEELEKIKDRKITGRRSV